MSKFVIVASTFPASKDIVFENLCKLSMLQEIAYPYATFQPLNDDNDIQWEVNGKYSFYFKLFGIIPFGTHNIHVLRFSKNEGIYTREGNEHVPVWNHEIMLNEIDENSCEYSDKVEIDAGWKTIFIYVWAGLFYRHRQRKWIKFLSSSHFTID